MFRKLLVPTDGSDISIAGALRACRWPRWPARASPCCSCRTPTRTPASARPTLRVCRPTWLLRAQKALRAIERIRDAATAEGVAFDSLVVEDHQAAKCIVDAAQSCGADLIVMGSHGRSGLAKMVLGSVATKVLALSPVPMLIIK